VKFRLAVVGYVVVLDHFRLLMREPEIDTAANAVEVLQARYRRRYNNSARRDEQVWENRFSDVHVVESADIVARLTSGHQEPVKLELVDTPEDWGWSSARACAGLSEGVVTVEQFAGALRQAFSLGANCSEPTHPWEEPCEGENPRS
jgi:putative transposase